LSNKKFTNTEPKLGLFPKGVLGNKIRYVVIDLMKKLKYNAPKFYDTYLKGKNAYSNKINPTYIQMSKIKSSKEASRYFKFKHAFKT
jgi:hypothetical protein